MSSATSSRFNAELAARKTALQNCQNERAHASCSQCERMCGCEVRDAYVHAVYLSMSGGVSQNFNF